MSQPNHPHLIIEWAPGNVTAYDVVSGQTKTGTTIANAVAGLPTSNVLVAVSRRISFIRSLRVPNASRADIAMIIRNQLGSLFPLPPIDLAFDFEMSEDITPEGRLVVVAALAASHLKILESEANAAHVKVRAVVPAPYGSVEVAKERGMKDAAILQDVADGLTIDIVAEGVLRYSRSTLLRDDVSGEVARTFAASNLPMSRTIAAGNSDVIADARTSKGTLASLASIDLVHPPMNLELAERKAAREAAAKASRLRMASLALFAAVCIVGYFGYDRYEAKQQVDKAALATKTAQQATKIKQTTAEKELAKWQPGADAIKRAFSPAQGFDEIMTVLTTEVPDGIWLSGFTIERGKVIILRGTALSSDAVSAYTHRLSLNERLRNVTFSYAQNAEIEQKPVVQFALTCFPVGNLPLVDATKPKSSTSSTTTTTTTGGTSS